ncbi:hypothetical protein [Cylindrospermopsis raciborskii]|nr:hypothetical protein [Cylindrospermopsis raciborskii]
MKYNAPQNQRSLTKKTYLSYREYFYILYPWTILIEINPIAQHNLPKVRY